ncbi:ABC transporter permease, partial [Rhizobiaceae sp. 2RAB30]
LLATLGCLIIGFPTAWFIATRPREQRMTWLFLITIPYWTNLLIRTLSILLMLRDEGPINNTLRWLGVIETPLPLAYNDWAVGIGLVYSYLPFMVLPIFAAVERIDLRLLDTAADLYAGRLAILRHIVLPLSKGGIVAGCVLVFVPSVGAYLAPDLLGGGKSMMIGNLIAQQFQQARNWPLGAALSVILLTVVLAILFVQATQAARRGKERPI